MAPPEKKNPEDQHDEQAAKGPSDEFKKSRGYKKFPDGKWDLTPHGQFKQLVKQNAAQSPLLRLPAEVRNQIWKYALGGTMIAECIRCLGGLFEEVYYGYRRLKDKHYGLLRASRQIYDETAALPYTLNPALCNHEHSTLPASLRAMPRFMQQSIATIRFRLKRPYVQQIGLIRYGLTDEHEKLFAKARFPSLRRLEIVKLEMNEDLRPELVIREGLRLLETYFKKGNHDLEVVFFEYRDLFYHANRECEHRDPFPNTYCLDSKLLVQVRR